MSNNTEWTNLPKLKDDLEDVHNWLRGNKLTLNDTTTAYMIIGFGHRLTEFENISEVSYAIGYNVIKHVNRKKSDGFIIERRSKWGMHIYAQCKKNSKNIALLRRANDGSNSILNELSKLQRRAARVITGQSYEVRSTQVLESLNRPYFASSAHTRR